MSSPSHRQAHRSHNDVLPPLSTAPRGLPQPDSPLSTTIPSSSNYPVQKKKYSCSTCQRGFTTSGHLARHARVHTGERNHKCPFPGCETRCSRQDNLQQHYRIHMSPGSRRTSGAVTRAHMVRQKTAPQESPASSRRRTKSPPLPLVSADQSAPTHNPACITSSPIAPSTNDPLPPPPNTPPPLAEAYRPSHAAESVSGRSSNRSSPELNYPHTYSSNGAPHPARVSHSPEATYAASPRHLMPQFSQNTRSWEQPVVDSEHRSSAPDASYAYHDADQAHSPASSSGGHLSAQPPSAHPVSPQSPYGYPGHYGMQHGGGNQLPSGVPAARSAATSLAPLRGTPPPPLAQSSHYAHSYPTSSSSTLIPHDNSTGLSIYNASQGRTQDVSSQGHPSSVTPTSAIAQQPYPNHYLPANAQSIPSPHHYTPHGTPSQSRQSSPPVVLAPIQIDRLPRAPPREMLPHNASSHQQHLPAQQQSQHSALPVNRVATSQGPHVGLTTSYSSHMHQSQQHTHGGPAQYPYSTYSTLSANQDQHQAHSNSHHDNWRADHYHSGRPSMSHSHSMSSTGLAV